MSTKPVPGEWSERMLRRGFSYRGEPSMSALARKANVSVETARRFIQRKGESRAEVTAAISAAMGEDMSWWIDSKPARDVYVGPDSSRLLDDRQRDALTRLIQAFVKGVDDAGNAEAEKRTRRGVGIAGVEATPVGQDRTRPAPVNHPELH